MKEIGSIPAFIINEHKNKIAGELISIQLTPLDIKFLISDLILQSEKSESFGEQEWYHKIVNMLNERNSEYKGHKFA